MNSIIKKLLIVSFVGSLYYFAIYIKNKYGITFNESAINDFQIWIKNLGIYAPLVFILLVTFRIFIGLSSHIVLIIGGLVFGSIGGIFLGAIGLSLSAVFLYLIGQSLGKNWFKNKFKKTHLIIEEKINLYGLLPVFLITAHPLGPQTPINFAAGVMNLPIMKYVLIILIATPIRATFYSILGATILTLSITKIIMVTFGLILIGLLPIYISNLNHAGLDLINKK